MESQVTKCSPKRGYCLSSTPSVGQHALPSKHPVFEQGKITCMQLHKLRFDGIKDYGIPTFQRIRKKLRSFDSKVRLREKRDLTDGRLAESTIYTSRIHRRVTTCVAEERLRCSSRSFLSYLEQQPLNEVASCAKTSAWVELFSSVG